MDVLDDQKRIDQFDHGHSLISIGNFPLQCRVAWEETKSLSFPAEYKTATAIVFAGMGGSAYAGRVIASLFAQQLNVPIITVNDYRLPAFVSEKTLVIAASYSGNTEEPLSCIEQALNKKAKIIGVCSGGAMAAKLEKADIPVYTFSPTLNPSNQPRIGQGYMIMSQIGILCALGFLDLDNDNLSTIFSTLEVIGKTLKFSQNTKDNQAKTLAHTLEGKIVHLIGGPFLAGAIHAIRNPFHETGKHFADYSILPELNHHLMEGLTYPNSIKKLLCFCTVHSDLYDPIIKRRMMLTEEVIKKQSIRVYPLTLTMPTRLGQVLELIQFGNFVTFYLAMLHGVDPAKIPWVDYFKKNLHARNDN